MKRAFFAGLLILCLCSCQKPVERIDIATHQVIAGEKIPLVVTHVSPIGSVEGARESFKILVGFNQAMTPLQAIPRDQTDGPLEIEPSIDGKYRWLGSRTLSFIPADTLPPATAFTVTLRKDKIQSLTGMRLERDTSWTFESVRPMLLSSLPRRGANFVETRGAIYLNFNLVMAPQRARKLISVQAEHGIPSKSASRCDKKPSFQREVEEIQFRIRQLNDSEKKDWPLRAWENRKTLVLVPSRPLPVESRVAVTLHQGLLATRGNLGLSSDRTFSFVTFNVFTLPRHSDRIPGGSPLFLCFSNAVALDEVVKNLSVEPAVELPEEYKKAHPRHISDEIRIYYPFALNSKYDIKISKELKDRYGNPLDKDYEFGLNVGDYDPHAGIPTGINVLESKSDLRFPATFVNVDSVYLEMGVVSLEQAVSFLSQNRLFDFRHKTEAPGLFSVSRLWHANCYERFRNKRVRLPIELKEVLRKKDNGLVFVQFDNLGQDGWKRYLKSFLEVGDLGVTWKYSPENNLVWVTSLNSTQPVKNARVQFRDDDNVVLYEGLTDYSGLCELPGWAEAKIGEEERTREYESEYEMKRHTTYREPKFWITVSKENDAAIYSNRWHFGIAPWRFNIPYNWKIRSQEYGLHMFTEKGLYRSGETVHITGILRKMKRGKWVLPGSRRVAFVVKNSRNEEIVNDTLPLSSYGAFFKDIPLSEDAPTGVYSVQAGPSKDWIFSHSFRVEAFRPAEFEVKATAESDTFIAGENFRGKTSGKYLFGMAMANADVDWSLWKDHLWLSYPKHKGYSFGGDRRKKRGRGVIASGRGKLDDKGEYQVVATLSAKDIDVPSVITLEGTVTAPDKRTISGRQNWPAFPSSMLVGIKTQRRVYVLGDQVDLSLITIRPSGQKVAGKRFDLELTKQEWKSVRKARLGGRYEWVNELVEKQVGKQRGVSRSDSTVVKLTVEEPGHYYVRATAKDEKRRSSSAVVHFYIAGKGHAGWQMRDDDIIELVPDKDSYEVRDTARILIKSPYDSANALITVERELVLRRFTTTLHGNADHVNIPIEEIDLPNVYVCVTLLRGRVEGDGWDEEKHEDLGKPQFKIGYVNLVVDSKEKHLVISTHSDRENYRPRDSVAIFFDVKDYRGRPVSNSDVSLFVVDLGVLNLIAFRTPDPFGYFYGPRRLSVKTVESRLNIIGERSYGEKGEDRGGGGFGEEGVRYREKFLSTVFYQANLKTDQQGKGKVEFVLPDNLTKFRIMVVAQTKTSEFGSAESTLVVNLPFLMTGSIPRFARMGDEFGAGVVLHNRTEKEETAQIQCRISGLMLVGRSEKEVSLPPGSSREVIFSFVAEKTGNAVFEFSATMGKEQDALRLTIPVKSPPLVEAVATFSSTSDSSLEAIIVPLNIFENVGGLEVGLSSSVLAGMQRGIEHLLDYPYACLEQRVSRILPLIVGEEIINQFSLARVSGNALRDTVQSVLDEVPEYQLPGGGFVTFKKSCCPCPYLSAYTMYILKRAEGAGYRIDPHMIETGRKFLREALYWNDLDWTYPYNEYARLTTKAFCLYSMSIWNDRDPAYASKLFERRDQIPIFGKTLLLKAGRNLSMGRAFEDELARAITNKLKFSPTSAHFEESENRGWTFPSPAKVTGYVIHTFTELDIPFAYKDQVIRWLVQERGKKSLPTTHENAFVFDAFQTYYKRFEREEPDFTAKVVLGAEQILKEAFKGRTNKPPELFEFSLDSIARDTILPIRISKQGKGRLYYTLRMRYAYKENPILFDEGFYVWKEILSLKGKPVTRFKRGEVYKVVLHIVVPETRIFGVVEDPLPAGFQPVQTYFATESRAVQRAYREERSKERGHWWGGFDHQEHHDDKVLLFGQELFPGEHTRVYFMKAHTSGKFLMPATKAEEMYSPEVFGSTTQQFVTVE